jgi:hypothetical protein
MANPTPAAAIDKKPAINNLDALGAAESFEDAE